MNNYKERVQNAIELMQNNQNRALDLLNDIISDLDAYSPEEIKENNLTWEVINAYNAKGSILNGENKIDEAEECFDRVIDYYGENDPCALLNKGIISRKRENYNQALDYYDNALKEDSYLKDVVHSLKQEIYSIMKENIDDADLSPKAKELLDKGKEFSENQNYFAAIDCFKEAKSVDPSCEGIAYGLIDETKYKFKMIFQWEVIEDNENEISNNKRAALYYLFNEKNPGYAFAINEHILCNFDENDKFALNSKGLIRFYLDDYEGAIESFDKCLEVDENYMWAYINKGIVLKAMGRDDEARESYSQIMTMPRRFKNPDEELLRLYRLAVSFNSIYYLELL